LNHFLKIQVLNFPIYYYRDKDKKEINLLIFKDGVIYPLEFKKSTSPGKDSVRHFKLLEKPNIPIGHGGVLCLSDTALPIAASINMLPIKCIFEVVK